MVKSKPIFLNIQINNKCISHTPGIKVHNCFNDACLRQPVFLKVDVSIYYAVRGIKVLIIINCVAVL